jgi:hypothetical protein
MLISAVAVAISRYFGKSSFYSERQRAAVEEADLGSMV